MKPFDLAKALAGNPVITRDGKPVTQLTHFEGVSCRRESVFGLIDGKVSGWYENGDYYDNEEEHANDLFMAPKVKEGWINIYQTPSGEWRTYGPIYDSEEAAANHNADAVPPIRIEWEVP